MGICKFCGQGAGLFRSQHSDCEQKYENGKLDLRALIAGAFDSAVVSDSLQDQVKAIGEASYISETERRALLVEGWDAAVERSLEDGTLDEKEEKRLVELMNRLSLSKSDLERSGALERVIKAVVIRDILNGIVHRHPSNDDNLPINLQED